MTRVRKLLSVSTCAALLMSSIAPAYAGHRGWNWGQRRHHDRVDVDDIITGVFVIGVIAAIASGNKKSRRDRDERSDRDEDWQRNRSGGDDDRYRGAINSEEAAVDACAMAAESRAGQAASVREITDVVRNNDGWDVAGQIEKRTGWRDKSAARSSFACEVRFGRVERVTIDSEAV